MVPPPALTSTHPPSSTLAPSAGAFPNGRPPVTAAAAAPAPAVASAPATTPATTAAACAPTATVSGATTPPAADTRPPPPPPPAAADAHAHAVTYVGWPVRPDNWRAGAAPAQAAVAALAAAIAAAEPAAVLAPTPAAAAAAAVAVAAAAGVPPAAVPVYPSAAALHAGGGGGEAAEVGEAAGGRRRRLRPPPPPPLPRLAVAVVPMDDCWLRDTGPVYLTAAAAGVHFRFNAWGGAAAADGGGGGGCYPDYAADAAVGATLLAAAGVPRTPSPLVMEGGALSADGDGTALTTASAVLAPNRHAGDASLLPTVAAVEGALHAAAGIRKVVWLPAGLAADADTDGHVDNVAVFARPGHVVLHWAPPGAADHASCVAAAAALAAATDAAGRRLVVHRVRAPAVAPRSRVEAAGVVDGRPGVVRRRAGDALAASYVNYVRVAGGVVAPSFGEGAAVEAEVAAVLRSACGWGAGGGGGGEGEGGERSRLCPRGRSCWGGGAPLRDDRTAGAGVVATGGGGGATRAGTQQRQRCIKGGTASTQALSRLSARSRHGHAVAAS
ncbi:hypothetical protein BU14_0031s0024 [Porphyra umbilicalis]|uniref:Agmatine deiminase n=1 Tax=Porphyra umbilicalis TaxID=2786 RepID=A0A1X6PJ07_PORUM|nr:hypothetical protein BU14_0031s0024 [Porphyra umbilicalis]|eukprot:OSX80851.1 hypothetical protein BU14_0031s0024 [Porphyra umbilicalis]